MGKGEMIRKLKQAGIRRADKENTNMTVKLEHLKTFQVIKLYAAVYGV